ncbi:hypothetical protein CUMW_214270 [Citrus unshiu]|uniref:Uncharacterized protein n=1 Tax=Citrus unshiu TaxID=55188 RepID=A0A2H5QBP7_CITUN|nr:hypothetical protein CUMW_214270 [Citrus unshiu]
MGTMDSAIKLKSKVAHAATAGEFNNNVPYLTDEFSVELAEGLAFNLLQFMMMNPSSFVLLSFKFLEKEVKRLKRIVKLVLGNSRAQESSLMLQIKLTNNRVCNDRPRLSTST